jgi:hypothetical protein
MEPMYVCAMIDQMTRGRDTYRDLLDHHAARSARTAARRRTRHERTQRVLGWLTTPRALQDRDVNVTQPVAERA